MSILKPKFCKSSGWPELLFENNFSVWSPSRRAVAISVFKSTGQAELSLFSSVVNKGFKAYFGLKYVESKIIWFPKF